MDILPTSEIAVLNVCAKCLARTDTSPRHDFGQFGGGDDRGRICEGWRFPIVDSYADAGDPAVAYAFNAVTFVFGLPWIPPPQEVAVVGTFGRLYDPVPLRRIAGTPYAAVTLKLPKGHVYTYRFIADGRSVLDPINPQRTVLENGREWSRVFTHLCSEPLSFDRRELALLDRLTAHILPFRTAGGENFLRRFYFSADRQAKETQYAHAYRLDQPVGVVNFIDKLLAREESHHLLDYRVCLRQIDRVLRQRQPVLEPADAPRELFVDLYAEMWNNAVPGWDYGAYREPKYFLQLLRRHTFTGAFSHPKYGGNVGAAGWAYLDERFRAADGQSRFDWRRVIEPPLGTDPLYRG